MTGIFFQFLRSHFNTDLFPFSDALVRDSLPENYLHGKGVFFESEAILKNGFLEVAFFSELQGPIVERRSGWWHFVYLEGVSESKKSLISAFWVSDYCRNGSKS